MSRAANWNTEVFDVSVAFLKEDGSVGKVQDGSIKWSVDNPDVTVTPAADGLSAVISATANAGFIVSVDADGDLGTAVLKLHDEASGVFSDTDVEAVQAGITLGEPRAKDAANLNTPVAKPNPAVKDNPERGDGFTHGSLDGGPSFGAAPKLGDDASKSKKGNR